MLFVLRLSVHFVAVLMLWVSHTAWAQTDTLDSHFWQGRQSRISNTVPHTPINILIPLADVRINLDSLFTSIEAAPAYPDTLSIYSATPNLFSLQAWVGSFVNAGVLINASRLLAKTPLSEKRLHYDGFYACFLKGPLPNLPSGQGRANTKVLYEAQNKTNARLEVQHQHFSGYAFINQNDRDSVSLRHNNLFSANFDINSPSEHTPVWAKLNAQHFFNNATSAESSFNAQAELLMANIKDKSANKNNGNPTTGSRKGYSQKYVLDLLTRADIIALHVKNEQGQQSRALANVAGGLKIRNTNKYSFEATGHLLYHSDSDSTGVGATGRVSPALGLRLELPLIPQKVLLKVSNLPRLISVGLAELSNTMPFMNNNIRTKTATQLINAIATLNLYPTNYVQVDFSAARSNTQNQTFLINSETHSNFFDTDIEYGNTAKTSVLIGINYRTSRLEWHSKMAYNRYKRDSATPVYHLPTVEVHSALLLHLGKKYTALLSADWATGMLAYSSTSPRYGKKMNDIVDLSTEFNFKASKSMNIFVKGRNLLFRENQRYLGYSDFRGLVELGLDYRIK